MPSLQRTLLPLALALGASHHGLAQQAATMEEIVVYGDGSQVELSKAYAGGQVARGGRAGLLGNLDFLDAPFAGSAYTAELVLDQQSESVGDVLQNDPVVRVAKGFGNFQEVYIIRGFPVFSDDITLNGVYGILPRQVVTAELVERVEVFRGANAFTNGAAPGGSGVGGTINLVPKRAPDQGIRQLTLGYDSGSQFSGAVDLGQRFGADQAWGVRFNAMHRDGEAAIEDEDQTLSLVSLGTDYAGERFRFSADVGYQDNRIDAPRPQVTPLGAIPGEPDADANFAQPWTFTEEEQIFGVVRGEFDVYDNMTIWLGAGARDGKEANVLANPSALADGSLSAFRFDNTREDQAISFDAGLRFDFNTGSIGHRLVISASSVDLESDNAFALSSFFDTFASNLYQPVNVAPPPADFFTGGNLNSPLTTEAVNNQSLAIADTLALLDDRLLVTIGLRRQSIETKSFDFNTGARLGGYDDNALTPAAGVVWKLSPSVSLYGNYAESLQPGAIAPSISGGVPISNVGEVLEPFTGEQFELGAKYDGGRFGATASLFSLARPNAIVVDNRFTNDGEQHNRGLELSVFGEPLPGVRIVGGATYVDAELAETQGGINEGNRPIGVAELQANLNLEWDVPGVTGLTLDGRVLHTGDQETNEANSINIDSWTRFDLGLRYRLPLASPVTLRARVENITDEAYWASAGGFPGANYLILGNPRILSISASMNF